MNCFNSSCLSCCCEKNYLNRNAIWRQASPRAFCAQIHVHMLYISDTINYTHNRLKLPSNYVLTWPWCARSRTSAIGPPPWIPDLWPAAAGGGAPRSGGGGGGRSGGGRSSTRGGRPRRQQSLLTKSQGRFSLLGDQKCSRETNTTDDFQGKSIEDAKECFSMG